MEAIVINVSTNLIANNSTNTNNIVGFPKKSASSTIKDFLEKTLQGNKKNTHDVYKKAISQLLMFACNKTIETITWSDISSIDYSTVFDFQKHLLTKYKPNSINSKIFGCKSCWEFIYNFNKQCVDLSAFNIDKLKVNDKDIDSWDSLTEYEVYQLYDYCFTREYKPEVQQLFYEVCFVTGIRSGVVHKLTWNDFQLKTDKKTNKEIWCICVHDKTCDIVQAISDDLYKRLLDTKEKCSDKVFNVSHITLRETLSDFCKDKKINKNIVWHSLKKASMDFVYEKTKDPAKAARQGHHKSFEMGYRYYCSRNSDLVSQSSYCLFDKKYDISMLNHLTKEELLKLIEKCGQSVISQLVEAKNQ